MWTGKQVVAIAALVLVSTLGAATARAQDPSPGPMVDQPGVTPAEIQKMFEAVALVRAQEALKLGDDRYLPFLTRYKTLQDVRRRTMQERMRVMRELNRLTNDAGGPGGDEAAIKEQLKALADLDARSEADLHKAYEGIDAILDTRQQAKFRLFEELMERRKIELLMKARQANRIQRRGR